MPEWRNGRRSRLKICRWQQRAGSTPAFGTIANYADAALISLRVNVKLLGIF